MDEERDEHDAAEAAEANDFLPRSPQAYRGGRAKTLEKKSGAGSSFWIAQPAGPARFS